MYRVHKQECCYSFGLWSYDSYCFNVVFFLACWGVEIWVMAIRLAVESEAEVI